MNAIVFCNMIEQEKSLMHVYVNPLTETELFFYFNLIFLTFVALFHFLIENVQCIIY